MTNPGREQKGLKAATEARRPGLTFRRNAGTHAAAELRQVDPTKLHNAIGACVHAGAAIMFGRTQDGGAFSVVILDGADKVKEYPNTVAAFNELMDDIGNHYST